MRSNVPNVNLSQKKWQAACRTAPVLLLPTLMAGGILLQSRSARAQSNWTDAGVNNLWSTAANWNGIAPPSGDVVTDTLSNAASGLIDYTSGTTAITSFMSTGGSAFNMTGGSLTVTGSYDASGAGTLALSGNTQLTVDGVLEVDGGLTLTGLNASYGSAALTDQFPEIVNATILNTAINMNSNYYVDLNGVTFDGTTSLNTGAVYVNVDNGLKFTPTALTDGVAINIGSQGTLAFNATSTVPNPIVGGSSGQVNITMGSGSDLITGSGFAADVGYVGYVTGYGSNFTLAGDTNVLVNGGGATVGGGGANIILDGAITTENANDGVQISSGVSNIPVSNVDITNNGTFNATAAKSYITVSPGYGGTFYNNGTINITNGSSVVLENVGSVGTVNIDSNPNSQLDFSNGYTVNTYSNILTPAELAGIKVQKGGGGVYLQGQLTDLNIGSGVFDPTSLNADGSSAYSAVHMAEGVISGTGTILHSDLILFTPDNTTSEGTWDGVKLSGDPVAGGGNLVLNLTATGSINGGSGAVALYFQNNVNFDSGSILDIGTVPGQGNASLLYNTTDADPNIVIGANGGGAVMINLGSASTQGAIGYGSYNYYNHGNPIGYSITIEPEVTIQGTGYVGANSSGAGYGDGNSVINDGTITANIANQGLTVSSGADSQSTPSKLYNYGTIQSTASGSFAQIASGITGTITNGSSALIAATSGGDINIFGGTYDNSGGTFTNSGEVYADATGVIVMNVQSAQQTAGATIVDGALYLNYRNSATDTNTYAVSGGALNGTGTINGGVSVSGGTIGAGDTTGGVLLPGTLKITGSYSQTGGAMQTAISTGGAASLLSVTGSVSLGGTIGVQLNSGYVPTVGQTFGIVSGSSVSGTFTNPVGSANLIADSTNAYDFGVFYTGSSVSLVYEGLAGSAMSVPMLPSSITSAKYYFKTLQSGLWIDPTLTPGYELATTNGALFTSIVLPTGYSSPFTITSGGVVLGSYSPGSTVNFGGLSGGGTSDFFITGINPDADADDPTAFPVKTYFNESTADVTMSPISSASAPEPSVLALLMAAMPLGVITAAWRSGRLRAA